MRLALCCAAAALLLAAVPAAPLLAEEIVVDDAAPGVQFTGTWQVTTTSSGFLGDGYRFRVAGDGSSRVRWPFRASSGDGTYEVFARWTSGVNRASNATYVLTHASGTASVVVDQRLGGGAWRSLGTFRFTAGAAQGV